MFNRYGPSPFVASSFWGRLVPCQPTQESHGIAALAGAVLSYLFGAAAPSCPSLSCPTVHCSQVTCPHSAECSWSPLVVLAAAGAGFWGGWAARRLAWSYFAAVDGRGSPALGRSAAWRPS